MRISVQLEIRKCSIVCCNGKRKVGAECYDEGAWLGRAGPRGERYGVDGLETSWVMGWVSVVDNSAGGVAEQTP
jgi:hypothetical protein